MKCYAQPGFLNFLKAKINGLFSLVLHVAGYPYMEATLPVVCLREGCHLLEKIDANEIKRDTVKTVRLDHVRHVDLTRRIGIRYECIPCHKNIAHASNREFMPDMKGTCFVCHSDLNISYRHCTICHPRHPSIEGDVDEIYEIHEGAGVGCEDCHIDAHKANKISCMNCHDESYADLTTFRIKGTQD